MSLKTKTRKPPFQSTAIAKSLYWLGGHLSRIKTYSKMYSLDVVEVGPDYDDLDFTSNYIGRRWTGWHWGYEIGLIWSAKWDWAHWDHWALEHKGCSPSYCLGCKGYVCGFGDHEFDE